MSQGPFSLFSTFLSLAKLKGESGGPEHHYNHFNTPWTPLDSKVIVKSIQWNWLAFINHWMGVCLKISAFADVQDTATPPKQNCTTLIILLNTRYEKHIRAH
ncbi:hypothetical protein ACTXT7_014547 [Hymenolepis weldensis]